MSAPAKEGFTSTFQETGDGGVFTTGKAYGARQANDGTHEFYKEGSTFHPGHSEAGQQMQTVHPVQVEPTYATGGLNETGYQGREGQTGFHEEGQNKGMLEKVKEGLGLERKDEGYQSTEGYQPQQQYVAAAGPSAVTEQPTYGTTGPTSTATEGSTYADTEQPTYVATGPNYLATEQPTYAATEQPAYTATEQPAYATTEQPTYAVADPTYTSAQPTTEYDTTGREGQQEAGGYGDSDDHTDKLKAATAKKEEGMHMVGEGKLMQKEGKREERKEGMAKLVDTAKHMLHKKQEQKHGAGHEGGMQEGAAGGQPFTGNIDDVVNATGRPYIIVEETRTTLG